MRVAENPGGERFGLRQMESCLEAPVGYWDEHEAVSFDMTSIRIRLRKGGCGARPIACTRPLAAVIPVWTALIASCAPGDPPATQTAEDFSFGFTLGNSDAPVKVMEFSDYGCGYCRQFHLETFGMVKEEFIDTGKVQWTFVPFVNGLFTGSREVTAGVHCAAQQDPEKFERLNADLWSEQQAWRRGVDPEALIRGLAGRAAIDLAAYDECIDADRGGVMVDDQTRLAGQLGIRGTPTFLIDGFYPLQGTRPPEIFRDFLTAAHREVTRGEG